ncbi:MAG: sugar ABC transporter permease, partial [Treponema sp.]|nr:sugar ABC transporter permease [Treponema sp.]
MKSTGIIGYLRSQKGQKKLIIGAFIVIPLLLLFTFTYLPFGEMVGFSFYDMKYIGKRTFVGLRNYIDVFTRDDIFGALSISLYYMAGSIVQLVFALLLATLLSFKTKGGSIFKGVLFFPFMINGIAVGFIFKFFFTHGYVLDTVLGWFGFPEENLP